MTYYFGLVGMVQAILLPGLCLTISLKNWSWTQRILFAPPFSLFLNYYLVWTLVSLDLYSQIAMILVIHVELAWIIFRARNSPAAKIEFPPVERWGELLLLLLGVAALTKYTDAWVRSFGDVFQLWDAVASWSPWGREWFQGMRPYSNLYPHALTISFSIPYAFMGSDLIETFSKAGVGLLFLASIACLLELGFRDKKARAVAWACAAIFPSVQARFLQSHWISGYADVPVTTILVFAFCLSYLPGRSTPWLFGMISGTAGLVKQAGLAFAILSPLLAGKWRNASGLPKILGGAVLVAGPWYAYLFVSVYFLQRDASNAGYLMNIISGGLLHRWGVSWSLVLHYGGALHLAAYLVFASLGCWAYREARRWMLFLGLPYGLIWATFFGYDNRNIAMALFPLALAVSAGVAYVLTTLEDRYRKYFPPPIFEKIRRPSLLTKVIFFTTIALCLVSLKKPIRHWMHHGSLIAWEKEQRLSLGDDPHANKLFAKLIACDKNASFLTNYQWLTFIPQLERHVSFLNCAEIREAMIKKENAYVFLHSGFCDLAIEEPKALYVNGPLRIFSVLPQTNGCSN